MELTINLAYEQVVEIVRQLPTNQVAKLLVEAQHILANEKPNQDKTSFQQFLLSAPTMSDEQYEVFIENRKAFNQWRPKHIVGCAESKPQLHKLAFPFV